MTSPNTIIADLTAEVETLRKQRDEWKARSEFSYVERSKLARQRDELLNYLHDAATSLETIAVRSYGEESYLNSKEQMRGYASSRAAATREDIARAKGGS